MRGRGGDGRGGEGCLVVYEATCAEQVFAGRCNDAGAEDVLEDESKREGDEAGWMGGGGGGDCTCIRSVSP
jgi:hypothetical protein